jgi:hypothetical protein
MHNIVTNLKNYLQVSYDQIFSQAIIESLQDTSTDGAVE